MELIALSFVGPLLVLFGPLGSWALERLDKWWRRSRPRARSIRNSPPVSSSRVGERGDARAARTRCRQHRDRNPVGKNPRRAPGGGGGRRGAAPRYAWGGAGLSRLPVHLGGKVDCRAQPSLVSQHNDFTRLIRINSLDTRKCTR